MSLSPPSTLTRLPYFIRWILLLVGIGLIAALTLPLLTDELRLVFLLILIPLMLVYRVVWLDLPRVRSISWNPWILLLLLVPVVNTVFQILLFAMPATIRDGSSS